MLRVCVGFSVLSGGPAGGVVAFSYRNFRSDARYAAPSVDNFESLPGVDPPFARCQWPCEGESICFRFGLRNDNKKPTKGRQRVWTKRSIPNSSTNTLSHL